MQGYDFFAYICLQMQPSSSSFYLSFVLSFRYTDCCSITQKTFKKEKLPEIMEQELKLKEQEAEIKEKIEEQISTETTKGQ